MSGFDPVSYVTGLKKGREEGGGGETPTLDAVLKKGNTSTENVTVGNLYTLNVSGNRTDIEPAGISTTYLYEGKDNQKNAGLMYDAVYLEHLEKQPNGTYVPVTDFAVNSNGNVNMNDAVKQGFKDVLEVPEAYDDTALTSRVSANETAIANCYTKAQTNQKIAEGIATVDSEHFHPVTVLPDVADAKENHEYILIEYEQDGETIKSKKFYLFYDGAYHEDRAADVSLDGYATEQYVDDGLAAKQEALVSGTNIKTVNGNSLMGAGNLVVGQDFEVGVERWAGTYTEDGVTYQVYSKIIKIDALPSTAGITNYPHGIVGIKQILSVYGFTTDGFIMNASRQNAQDNIAIYQVSKNATTGSVAIEVGKNRSDKKAFVCLVYAKNN